MDADEHPISQESPAVVICLDSEMVSFLPLSLFLFIPLSFEPFQKLYPRLRVLLPARYPLEVAAVLFNGGYPPSSQLAEFEEQVCYAVEFNFGFKSFF